MRPERTANLETWLVTAAVALTAGFASGFFGIGGGFLIVPGLLLATNMPMIEAIGSSLLAVGAFALATALNYALSGRRYADVDLCRSDAAFAIRASRRAGDPRARDRLARRSGREARARRHAASAHTVLTLSFRKTD